MFHSRHQSFDRRMFLPTLEFRTFQVEDILTVINDGLTFFEKIGTEQTEDWRMSALFQLSTEIAHVIVTRKTHRP